MKLTLTTEEIKTAITLYLRANAAVEVSDMDFSAKREGVIAEVEEEFIELKVEPVVANTLPVAVSEEVEQYESTETTVHEAEALQESYKGNPEELVEDASIEVFHALSSNDVVVGKTKPLSEMGLNTSAEVSDTDIESIEAALSDTTEVDEVPFEVQTQLNFDDEPEESNEVEEMPVQNPVSIADILGY